MTRYLALDIGERRIGLALGDSSNRLAVPLRTHHRGKDRDADLTAIAATAGAEGVDAYVIGLPMLESGVEGAQVRAVRAFAHALSIASPLPVHWQDERYTTFEAGAAAGSGGGVPPQTAASPGRRAGRDGGSGAVASLPVRARRGETNATDDGKALAHVGSSRLADGGGVGARGVAGPGRRVPRGRRPADDRERRDDRRAGGGGGGRYPCWRRGWRSWG